MFRRLAWGKALSLLLIFVAFPALAVSAPGFMTGTATASPTSASGTGAAAHLRVGSQSLTRCGTSPAAYCGTLKVPLDWQIHGGPDISVCYRWYPATATGRPEGTVLPVEGGPGYPSILSVAPDGYSAMYGPSCSALTPRKVG